MARVRELPLPPGTALTDGSAPPEAAGARGLDVASSARRGQSWSFAPLISAVVSRPSAIQAAHN